MQWMLVDPWVELHFARLALYDAATRADKGEDVRVNAYMVKLFCTDAGFRAFLNARSRRSGLGEYVVPFHDPARLQDVHHCC